MEIIQTTSIKLEDAERDALETLRAAYLQCISTSCFECDECPLYADENCVGLFADHIMEREKRGK